ncbi:hypothetical protein LCGC14_1663540 [marine sediment metagenome]|uniref:Uncharacterized protein n=1 Tax=marine sediment metagenome TaxID=412755 RepID=A0A0F9HU47_9ZZZZ
MQHTNQKQEGVNMGLLSAQTSGVPDLVCAPKGQARLTITAAEEKLAKTGRPMLCLQYDSPDYPEAMTIYDNVMGPKEGDPQKTIDAMLRGIGEFKKALGYGADDDVPTDTLVGLECVAMLGIEDRGKGPRNTVDRYLHSQADDAGNAASEEAQAETPPAPTA